MAQLVLVRHGQSTWNLENRFTGWVDVDLSPLGVEEAHRAGQQLKNYHFDYAFTSELVRAQHTLQIILEEIGQTSLPVTRSQALNERHYGDLQGLNKAETVQQYGEALVNAWRRSFRTRPPNGESLEDTYHRVVPYYRQTIAPLLRGSVNVLIAAHGNSLRALVMYLKNLSEAEVEQLEIPTGIPEFFTIANNPAAGQLP